MIQSTKSLSNVSTNHNNPVQSEHDRAIQKVDWSKDQIARLWVETSIKLRELNKSTIMKELAVALNRKPSAISAWYYRHMAQSDFDQYWMDKFTAYHRMRLAPKGYAKLNELVDKERDISKVVEAIQQAEGKEQAPTVQINNFVKNEKNTYGI